MIDAISVPKCNLIDIGTFKFGLTALLEIFVALIKFSLALHGVHGRSSDQSSPPNGTFISFEYETYHSVVLAISGIIFGTALSLEKLLYTYRQTYRLNRISIKFVCLT